MVVDRLEQSDKEILGDAQLHVLHALHAYSGEHYTWRDHTYFNDLKSSPIQKSFARWLESSAEEASTFYLSGRPGTGKTSHFNLFLREIYSQQGDSRSNRELGDRVIVSFFHDDARNSAGSLGSMAALTMFQILAQRPDLAERIRDFYFTALQATSVGFPALTSAQFLSMMASLVCRPFPAQLVFALDGLDEWDPPPGPFIQRLIDCAKDAGVVSKLIICGGSEEPQVIFGPCLSLSTSMSFAEDKGRLAFLDREMNRTARVRPGISPFLDTFSSQIRQQDMSFLEMQMASHLMRSSSLRSLPKNIRKLRISETPPGGTPWLYKAALDELESDTSNGWILNALTWALFSMRPLTTQELAVAVAIGDCEDALKPASWEAGQDPILALSDEISTDIADDLYRCLGPLWDLEDGFARIRHRTFKELCLSRFSQKFQPSLCHAVLAESCIRYLSLITAKDVWVAPCTSPRDDLLRNRAFDFRDYATSYWPAHYRLAEPSDEVNKLVLEFLGDASRREKWHKDFEALEIVKTIFESPTEATKPQVSEAGADLSVMARHGLLGVVRRRLQMHTEAQKQASRDGQVQISRGVHYTQDDIDFAADAASQAGFDDVFDVLCEHSEGAPGKLALYHAALGGNRKIVNKLLSLHADISRRGGKEATPLYAACMSGDEEVARALVDISDVAAKTTRNNNAMHVAAGMGSCPILKLLLGRDSRPTTLTQKNAVGFTPLQYAVGGGHMKAVNLLLEAAEACQVKLEADVNEDGETPLHEAARRGYLDLVAHLWKAGLSPVARSKEGITPLFQAAWNGHLSIVELFCRRLKSEEGLEEEDEDGDTALSVAALSGWTGVARALIRAGADMHHKDKASFTVLQRAAGAGFVEVVKLLRSTGGGDDAPLAKEAPGLPLAANFGHFFVAEYLLRHGEDVNATSPAQGLKTALFHAAGAGQAEMVSFLIGKGATVNPAVDTEYSALHFAARGGHLRTVTVLVENGASVTAMAFPDQKPDTQPAPSNAAKSRTSQANSTASQLEAQGASNTKAYSKRSPLHAAAAHPIVLKYLIGHLHERPECPTSINACDESGLAPLHCAAAAGQVDSIKALVEAGALQFLSAPDIEGITPLHYAANEGAAEAVDYLLELGADTNAVDADGWCPLHVAARSGDVMTLKSLMRWYKDKNIKTSDGSTALHVACRTRDDGKDVSIEAVQMLIDWGCDIQLHDDIGFTPLSEATHAGSVKVVKLLLSKGASIDPVIISDGVSLMHLAAATNANVLRLIIDAITKIRPPDIHKTTLKGGTALHFACSKPGYPECVSILLEPAHKLDPNAEDIVGNTPVMVCCHYEKDNAVAVLGILMQNGGEACHPNKQGTTPLHVVSFSGYSKHLTLLLDHCIDLNIKNAEDKTPLHLAAIRGHVDICRLLCEGGADVNSTSGAFSDQVTPLVAAIVWDGENAQQVVDYFLTREDVRVNGEAGDAIVPLCAAITRGSLDTVQALLGRPGIDLEACGRDGMTPILTAVGNSSLKVMKLLLDRDVNLSAHSGSGRSLLAVVVDEGDLKMAEMLFQKDPETMAKLSRETWNHLTPLQMCLEDDKGSPDMEKFLIDHGASVDFEEGTTSPLVTAALRRDDILPAILEHDQNIRPQRWGLEELRVAVEVLNVELWRRFAHCLPTVVEEADQDGWHLCDVVRQSKSKTFMALVSDMDHQMADTILPEQPYKAPTAFMTPHPWASDNDRLCTTSEDGTAVEYNSKSTPLSQQRGP